MTAGGTTLPKSTIGFQRGFTGYALDEETGLYFARARMYSSQLGRFISRDPTEYVDGMSLYNAYFVPNGVDPDGLRWVKVYIWRARKLMVGWGRVGHAMVTEMNDSVILSQFPHGPGGASHPTGPNTRLDKTETEKEEGGAADEVYYVWVPDDAAFDKTAAEHVARKNWNWKPSKPDQTHCTRAAYDALKDGKVPVSGQDDGQVLPGTLGDILKDIGGKTVILVTPTTPVPVAPPSPVPTPTPAPTGAP